MQMPKASAEAVAAFERLLPSAPSVTRRLMFGHPAAFANGHMFLGVFGSDLFVRVAPQQLDEVLRLPGFRPFEPMPGRAMTGYVVLPPEIRSDPRRAGMWVERAKAAAESLPPKVAKGRGTGPKGAPRPRKR